MVEFEATFTSLVQHIFALDPNVQWLALEEAAREPRWAWRDQQSGCIHRRASCAPAELVDPLLFMIAEGICGVPSRDSGQAHKLLFAVLAYRDLVQVVARFGQGSHVTVAAAPEVDAYRLGTRISEFVSRWAGSRPQW